MHELNEYGFEEVDNAGFCYRCQSFTEIGGLYFDCTGENYYCGWCADTVIENRLVDAEKDAAESEECDCRKDHRIAA